jgi:hypothetical protein
MRDATYLAYILGKVTQSFKENGSGSDLPTLLGQVDHRTLLGECLDGSANVAFAREACKVSYLHPNKFPKILIARGAPGWPSAYM